MDTRPGKSSHLFLLIAGGAAVLFGTVGFARMTGWSPDLAGDTREVSVRDRPAPAVTREAGASPRCPECGVILSVREVERRETSSAPGASSGVVGGNGDGQKARSNTHYEITVRMADGSSRVIHGSNLARWRTGERLMVIAGTESSFP